MTEPTPEPTPETSETGFVVLSGEQLLAALTGHPADHDDVEAQPPSRLLYADELAEGMVVDAGRGCVVPGHTHRAWCSILRVRSEAHVVSAILVDEHGEQRPGSWHDIQTVRVQA